MKIEVPGRGRGKRRENRLVEREPVGIRGQFRTRRPQRRGEKLRIKMHLARKAGGAGIGVVQMTNGIVARLLTCIFPRGGIARDGAREIVCQRFVHGSRRGRSPLLIEVPPSHELDGGADDRMTEFVIDDIAIVGIIHRIALTESNRATGNLRPNHGHQLPKYRIPTDRKRVRKRFERQARILHFVEVHGVQARGQHEVGNQKQRLGRGFEFEGGVELLEVFVHFRPMIKDRKL